MSDTHAHHGHDAHPAEPQGPVGPVRLTSAYTEGGHEIDATPNRNLFGFLGVMLIIMIVSAIGVYQLFVTHSEAQLADAASVPAAQLQAQREREQALSTSYGKVAIEGQPAAFRMPYSEARRRVIADPARLGPAPAPQGWIHPDDAGK